MTEKFTGDVPSRRVGRQSAEEIYGEAPEGVNVAIYEHMKATVADFIDQKITFMQCYNILRGLVNPHPDSDTEVLDDATKAVIQRELDLMYGSYL